MGYDLIEGEVRLIGPGTAPETPLNTEDVPVKAELEAMKAIMTTQAKLEEVRAMVEAIHTRLGDGTQTSDVVPMAGFVGQGVLTVPVGSAAPLIANLPCRSVTIRSDSTSDNNGNSKPIFIGGPDVTAGVGMVLRPGETFTIEVSNANAIYATARTSNQKLCWVAAL